MRTYLKITWHFFLSYHVFQIEISSGFSVRGSEESASLWILHENKPAYTGVSKCWLQRHHLKLFVGIHLAGQEHLWIFSIWSESKVVEWLLIGGASEERAPKLAERLKCTHLRIHIFLHEGAFVERLCRRGRCYRCFQLFSGRGGGANRGATAPPNERFFNFRVFNFSSSPLCNYVPLSAAYLP